MYKKKLLLATGDSLIDGAIKKLGEYEVVGRTLYKDKIEKLIEELTPDILLVTDVLSGREPLLTVLLKIKTSNPNIRIVYLHGKVNTRNEKEINALSLLVMAGIYDIVTEETMTLDMLRKALSSEMKESDVSYIAESADRNLSFKSSNKNVEFVIPEEFQERDENIRNNVFAISSIKPGTGKSFVSVNIATAIAKYGVDTEDGKRPRVALIEADLQNLSLGTLLALEEGNKNIKSVMDKIGEIVSETGDLYDSSRIEEVNEFIKGNFLSYFHSKNLKALVGSQLSFEEMQGISEYYYIYLIDAIMDEFDIIVIDTNSALTHITTSALLQAAKRCYYVINLDFNNIRNNQRYRETLKSMKIIDKVKYVLNEDVDDNSLLFTANHLDDAGFKLEARIPSIPKTTFLNKLYQGEPIILDEKKENDKTRYEIFKVANQIYPIKNFEEMTLKDELREKRSFFNK